MLRQRNEIDAELARLMQRPMTSGHLGEWIAAQVFDLQLEPSAVTAGIEGRFRSGPLRGCTVNIKWYLKREGSLDTLESAALDYYLASIHVCHERREELDVGRASCGGAA
jgi:hypothetical protein